MPTDATPTAGMTVVDFGQFILWREGSLLSFCGGNGTVVNEAACRAAEDALDRGESVVATRRGRVIGTLTPDCLMETTNAE